VDFTMSVSQVSRVGSAASGRYSGPERRGGERAEMRFGVRLVIAGRAGSLPAVLTDLSEGGCFFATDAQVRTGWSVSVAFRLKPRELCCSQGQIVRFDGQTGFGVQFEIVNRSLKSLITTLLATPVAQRRSVLESIWDSDVEIG
jgi:hypothetical protein